METVDLGHKVTLKDECDVVDYKALHAVSRRTQKLRSYKVSLALNFHFIYHLKLHIWASSNFNFKIIMFHSNFSSITERKSLKLNCKM